MLYSLVTYVTKNEIGEYVIIRRIEKGLFMSEPVFEYNGWASPSNTEK